MLCCCLHGMNEHHIRFASLRREARHMIAEVARVELRVLVDLSSQKAGTERAERNKADTKLFEHRQNIVFWSAPEKRVFTLQRCHRLHSVGLTDGAYARFRQSKVLDLSLGNQLFHCASDLLDRHIGIDAVLVEEVYMVCTKPL